MKTTALSILLAAGTLAAQQNSGSVSFDRILHATEEPQNWLTYSGTTFGQRHSLLTQITPENVDKLELQWVFQARSLEKFEATPLVVNGVLYTVQPPDDVFALDAATGRIFWTYAYNPSSQIPHLLRAREPGPGDSGRHAVHGNHRRSSAGHRRQDRPGALEHHGRRRQ